jgi:hypothetical protein
MQVEELVVDTLDRTVSTLAATEVEAVALLMTQQMDQLQMVALDFLILAAVAEAAAHQVANQEMAVQEL